MREIAVPYDGVESSPGWLTLLGRLTKGQPSPAGWLSWLQIPNHERNQSPKIRTSGQAAGEP